MTVQYLVLAALAALFAWIGWTAAFKTVRVSPWERAAVFLDGGFQRMLAPGRHHVLRGGRSMYVQRVSMTAQFMSVGPVEAVTAEGFPIRLSAIVLWRIVDAERSLAFPAYQVVQAAVAQALMRFAARHQLEALLAREETLDGSLLEEVKAPADQVAVDQVALGAVVMPPELRRSVTEVERARLEGQAALERARGEQAALRALANAARMLKDNPDLMRLRLLQALSAGKGTTLVLGEGALNGEAAGPAAPKRR
ncbi:SPFH domain-containing protein [Brevundimonas fluminis]|uniref:SPFH domain-containing protein n=1 Tax=Brevundimonas fluminis TaxID=2487274 RepID=UPI000F65752E|nr:SPFH domain-containing protein [Brevundimonas fluminis]